MTQRNGRIFLLGGLVAALALAAPARAIDEIVASVMYTDPDVPAATVVKVFPERLTSLWLQALDRPENDLKCQAAATIALAHQRGMSGLESTVAPLLRTLDQPEQHPTVRLAAARALITLDARQAAPSLFRHAQADGVDLRELVEPVLARWDYAPARAVWLERLNQAGVPGRARLLAIQALAAVREPAAVPRLRELALSATTEPILRLEAARALGSLQTSGLEKDAERLAAEKAGPGGVARLAAASLLRKHRGEEAARVLERLAVEADPAAAAVALDALLDDDPGRVLALLPRVLASPDAAVRGKGVEAFRRRPVAEHLRRVADLMDDPHPQVRVSARKALAEVGCRPDLGDAVRREGTRLLAGSRWQALEQAAILLTVLDHKPAAARLVELLPSDRPEVCVTAAWGLRKLAVAATLPAQQREIERRWGQWHRAERNMPWLMMDREVTQLAESLGQARYEPAAPTLARFIPKQRITGQESRAAAVWALGLIHAKTPPASLVEQLIDRLTDEDPINQEDLGVRHMSAVALGRMKAKAAATPLRKYYPGQLTTVPFHNVCGWALQEITGEKLPASGTVQVYPGGWFLGVGD